MQLTDILAQAGGLESLARQLGISETQATSGAQALLPAVMGGFQKQAQNTGGLGGLLGSLNSMLDANGDGNALDDILRMAGKAGSRQA
ncbi:DUF937 domain-containing protein [Castellaniella sp.]|uniref:DUF937 domain-containing protein n=1 Tax=Castellaniella sp. TaxID=1955812 RepID=UPI002AFFF720|nr:DUF937 domain-containing protein [Castellaniella sp.]